MTATTIEPYKIDDTHAEKLDLWLRTRGGVFVWKNLDLGSPTSGATSCTPATTQEGTPYPSPHWRFGNKPERHLTRHDEVVVSRIETVEQLPAKFTHQGLSAACRKKADQRCAATRTTFGGDVWWSVSDDPAAIFIKREAEVVPLSEYLSTLST